MTRGKYSTHSEAVSAREAAIREAESLRRELERARKQIEALEDDLTAATSKRKAIAARAGSALAASTSSRLEEAYQTSARLTRENDALRIKLEAQLDLRFVMIDKTRDRLVAWLESGGMPSGEAFEIAASLIDVMDITAAAGEHLLSPSVPVSTAAQIAVIKHLASRVKPFRLTTDDILGPKGL